MEGKRICCPRCPVHQKIMLKPLYIKAFQTGQHFHFCVVRSVVRVVRSPRKNILRTDCRLIAVSGCAAIAEQCVKMDNICVGVRI